jgi:hypothetical protein
MDRIIELPDSVYEALQAVAAKSGTDPVGWIKTQLAETEAKPETKHDEAPKTMYDLLKPHIGVVQSDGVPHKTNSDDYSQQFLEILLEKQRKGHL